MPENNPKVFISYSHDSADHEDRILQLTNRLRREGIDALIDQYQPAPPTGWPMWMDREIQVRTSSSWCVRKLTCAGWRGERTPLSTWCVIWLSTTSQEPPYDRYPLAASIFSVRVPASTSLL